MIACSAYVRERGAPYADLMNRKHATDLTGVGDVAIECTLTDWGQIGRKLTQACNDAARRGLPSYRVWKPRKAVNGGRRLPVGDGYAIMPIEQDWARERLIGKLELEILALRQALRKQDWAK